MKISYWLAGLGAVASLLAGCGDGNGVSEAEGGPETSTPNRARAETLNRPKCLAPAQKALRVSLDGHVGPENVSFWMAKRRGFFADAGIRVRVLSPIVPNRPVRYLTSRVDDIALAQQPQVVIARALGAPVVALGSVVPRPTAAMIWLRSSGIRTIADLEGKTVAYPGVPFQKAFLGEILRQGGLTLDDVEVKPVGYRLVSALLEGEADAIFGGTSNVEGVTLESRGAKPVIRRVQDLGIPDYEELVMVARTECVSSYPQVYRGFMAALGRSTDAALNNPGAAVALIEENGESDPGSSRKEIEAQVASTFPLLARNAQMNLKRAGGLVDWMDQRGLIPQEPPISELLTNEYLAP